MLWSKGWAFFAGYVAKCRHWGGGKPAAEGGIPPVRPVRPGPAGRRTAGAGTGRKRNEGQDWDGDGLL